MGVGGRGKSNLSVETLVQMACIRIQAMPKINFPQSICHSNVSLLKCVFVIVFVFVFVFTLVFIFVFVFAFALVFVIVFVFALVFA